jgi:SAM-dependent methyltransferase
VWGDNAEFATHDTTARGIKLQRRAPSDEGPAARELFLPWGYVENENRSADRGGTPFWDEGMAASDDRSQVPVYRLAARLVARRAWSPVVDVGCGTGHKLVRFIGGVTDDIVGADQDSAIDLAEAAFPDRHWLRGDLGDDALWKEVGAREPALAICADVVEHVDDPVDLLSRLREIAQPNGHVLISTPDRAVFEGASPLGPPTNPKHIREWTRDEFEMLLESVGFTIERAWHLLPRSYSFRRTELNRAIYRGAHLRAIPDRRSCMCFLVRPIVTASHA